MNAATAIAIDHGFTGLTGFAADVLTALGDFGVGVLVFIEVLIPPIPSEVILPFAGYLSQTGNLTLGWLIFWSTLASWIGALLLYWLGATIGMERAVTWLAATRLVSRSDLDRGAHWFLRSGGWTVLVGRLVPGVRSLISLPAGASRMNLARFSLYTVIGSGTWNALLIGVGAALGTQHERLEHYLSYLDYVVYAALGLAVVVLILRRIREATTPRSRRARADTAAIDDMTS
ncbi:DedA family protein [Microbacterium sp. zg.B48]|uniref:DedA family protein n=1 Tax=unclassified Microbacterium TaxID=2609290 RepID=UPI00214CA427|nr:MULTISPECIES: DedA family protein [unclassified Microbacterium]MCR2763891.1 DedA family protein [Microbacterium sp. zg.B48]MCR2810313.1 DedA family protein [Microbacterium sp. zg.B185]WIM18374.1 DedA family protein [Microbacterium sp. zg-B185]